jgi:hypothetical protein
MVLPIYWLPRGILGVFNTILYEIEFQNTQIFQQTISLFPEQSTLSSLAKCYKQMQSITPFYKKI